MIQEMEQGDQPQEPLPAVQESIGASHSPQHSVHVHTVMQEAPEGAVQKVRQYEKLRKNWATDFRGTTDPMEAELWLQANEQIFLLMRYTPEEKLDYIISLL